IFTFLAAARIDASPLSITLSASRISCAVGSAVTIGERFLINPLNSPTSPGNFFSKTLSVSTRTPLLRTMMISPASPRSRMADEAPVCEIMPATSTLESRKTRHDLTSMDLFRVLTALAFQVFKEVVKADLLVAHLFLDLLGQSAAQQRLGRHHQAPADGKNIKLRFLVQTKGIPHVFGDRQLAASPELDRLRRERYHGKPPYVDY